MDQVTVKDFSQFFKQSTARRKSRYCLFLSKSAMNTNTRRYAEYNSLDKKIISTLLFFGDKSKPRTCEFHATNNGREPLKLDLFTYR